MSPVRWDGTLRTFDDPERKPGEPWVAPFDQERHDRLIAELDEIRERPERLVDAAIASQGLAKLHMHERNEFIVAAMWEDCDVAALASGLGLSRQQIYAIAADGGWRAGRGAKGGKS